MNPLDVYEFSDFTTRLNKEMPLHTSVSSRIPMSYTLGLPKDLIETSSYIDNRFLNKYQDMVEEIKYRSPKNQFVKRFISYQSKYYEKSGILKGDNIFKKVIHSKHRASGGNLATFFISFGGSPNGVLIETNDGSTGTDATHFSTGFVYAQILPNTAIIGKKYDEVANNHTHSSGNAHLGVYDDNAGVANNRLADTGQYTLADNYNFHTFTEFTVPTTQMWTAIIVSSSGNGTLYKIQGANSELFMSQSYGALPTPFNNDSGGTTANPQCKIAHT